MKTIETLDPKAFRGLITTIGELPSSFVDSMSYYEMIAWIVDYIKKNVIPAVNNNAEAIKEIQKWIETLDLQDEVDNKLDEMAASGELADIISQYLNSTAIFGYDNVASMQSAENLVDGSFARTMGFYNKNDGGGALYKIRNVTNDDVVDGMSIISITSDPQNNLVAEIIIENNEINAGAFGVKGDGVNDDALNIQAAINKACEYIVAKSTSTGSFAGPITISLPDKKMFIKTQISTNQGIDIVGGGTNSTLVLADNLTYMIEIEGLSGTTITTNEEGHIEGGSIRNVRFDGNSRSYTCTSAVHLGFIDHFILDTLYFMCVKGKCIELEAAREGNITNIFTRFCGVYGSGCIEIITNHLLGDTSNLNMGSNWNIVYPFGNAIKFVDGEVHFINDVVIHGMFDNVINALETYFGSNDYQDTNNDFIYLNNSFPTFSNVSAVYCPDKSVYCKAIGAKPTFNNSWFQAHKSVQEQHNGYGNFFDLSSSSELKIHNMKCTCGSQNADLIKADGTSTVKGYISNANATYLYSDLDDYKRATRFTYEGELAQPVIMGYRRSDCFKSYGKSQKANMIFKQTDPDDTLTLNSDALYIGTNQYRSRTVVAIPDEGMFALPKITMSNLSYSVNHAIFFDENNNLKYMYYDDNSSSWKVKTVTATE